MVTLGIGVDAALAMIRKGRPIANPNPGFVAHLRKMEPRFIELAAT
jgi:hypothetical protein